MRVIVCDTGPILHLHEAEALQFLEKVGEVITPLAAARGHLQRGGAFSLLERLAKSSLWISPRVLNEARRTLERLFEG